LRLSKHFPTLFRARTMSDLNLLASLYTTHICLRQNKLRAAVDSANCAALVNNDLATLANKDLNAWVATKTIAIEADGVTCTAYEAGKVVASLQASPNLVPCSKDAGFELIGLFTNSILLPSAAQVKAAAESESCAALVNDANGLIFDFTCQMWNIDLAILVAKDLNTWVTTKADSMTQTSSMPYDATIASRKQRLL
jgi:hypothetical protein